MKDVTLTRSNLRVVVDSTVLECEKEIEKAKRANRSRAILDFQVAICALQKIQQEIKEGTSSPRGKRSAQFIRYVIDEGPGMVMNPELVKFIEQIEDFYDRRY